MNARSMIHQFLFRAVTVLFAVAKTNAATLAQDEPNAWDGSNFSFSVINGKPAVVYVTNGGTTVKFRRAVDAGGIAWNAPVVLSSDSRNISYGISLQTVDGNPAVCYHDSGSDSAGIKYIRAIDPDGNSWSTTVKISTGGLFSIEHLHLEIIGGRPAILYNSPQGAFRLVRAANTTGTSWNSFIPVTTVSGAIFSSVLRIADGHPAVAIANSSGVWYLRSGDAQGTAWNAAQRIATHNSAFFCSMEIVGGRPAVAFQPQQLPNPVFVRALDAAGTLWDAPVNIPEHTNHLYWYSSLSVIDGRLLLAFKDFDLGDVRLAEAADATGSSWATPGTIASIGDPGNGVTLREVDGRPAVVYFDPSRMSLEYRCARAGEGGALLWPAEFTLRAAVSGVEIPGTLDLGRITPGTTKTAELILTNPVALSGTVRILTVAISGPDAAEFSLSPSLENIALAPGGSIPVRLDYAPVTPGLKNALLTFVTDGSPSAFHLTVTANSAPEIVVTHTADGSAIPDGATLGFPCLAAGGTFDLPVTVRNTGPGDLVFSGFSIDGPDAAEFSVDVSPPLTVPPGGSAGLTLRHATVAGGGRSATFHLISNVPGPQGSYDIPFIMESGKFDSDFVPILDSPARCLAIQSNGAILAGGKEFLTSFLPDGAPDSAFFAPPIAGGTIECIALQKDGRILIGGTFQRAGGRICRGLARLLPDGTFDDSFSVTLPIFGAGIIAVRPGGKILAGGTGIEPPIVPWLIGFSPDGSTDSSFLPVLNGPVRCFGLQPGGKVLVGGEFTLAGGIPAPRLARFSPDGSRDPFDTGVDFTPVNALAVNADGGILAGYEAFDASRFRGGLMRFLPDGSRDATFALPSQHNGSIRDMALQADGKCIVSVAAAAPSNLRRLLRIRADGVPESGFCVNPVNANCVAIQADGSTLYIDAPGNVRRLLNEPAISLLTRSGSTVRWMRGGTAPEVRDVSFEVRTANSASWEYLGDASRIPGGWELTGLNLAAFDSIRARGLAGDSLMEAINLSSLASWRRGHFSIIDNSGPAADTADPDNDGLTNFTEFAFGLNPTDRESNSLPEFKYANESFTAAFAVPEGREGILYSAEWSPDMKSGSWTAIPDTGTGGYHTFSVSGTVDRVFVRYVLR